MSISYDRCIIDLSPNDKSYIIMTESITNIHREKKVIRDARLAGQAQGGNAEPDYDTEKDNLINDV